jgi:cell division septum initiation protein DivIVA
MYSEEEVDVLVDMLQKCKEYFLLKTDSKSEERADAIGEVLKQFKNK